MITCYKLKKFQKLCQQVTASSAVHHPNQYFDESHQALQGQGGASQLAGTAHSGLDHGKVNVKNEINTASNADTNVPKTDTNNDLGDIQMDDDDDDILGEIEKMDTMA